MFDPINTHRTQATSTIDCAHIPINTDNINTCRVSLHLTNSGTRQSVLPFDQLWGYETKYTPPTNWKPPPSQPRTPKHPTQNFMPISQRTHYCHHYRWSQPPSLELLTADKWYNPLPPITQRPSNGWAEAPNSPKISQKHNNHRHITNVINCGNER